MSDKEKKKGSGTRDFLTTNNEVVERAAQVEEPRLISILLKKKERLQDAIAYGIKPHYFRNKTYSYFFALMAKHYEKHNALLTQHAMESIMAQQKNYTEEDKSNRISEWQALYVKEKDDEDYILLRENINNRFIQDQMFTIIEEEAAEIVSATAKQDEIVKRIQERVNSITGVDPDEFSAIISSDEGFEEAYQYIIDRKDNPEKHQGILTGIRALDEEYYGFDYGSYTVISGGTNGGKSTLMMNIGWNMAKQGYNVVYISLEKKGLPIYVRLLCLHALVDYNRTKRGGDGERGLNAPTMKALDDAKEDLQKNYPNFKVVQMSQEDPLTKILAKVDEIKSEEKIDVVILDYLGCVGLESKTVGRPDLDQAKVSRRFQAYCKRNNYVGITGVQLKATASKEKKKQVKDSSDDIQSLTIEAEDLAGSQEVIRDADNSIGVMLNADQPPTAMYAHSTKARDNQGHRTIELAFDGFIGRVSDKSFLDDDIEEINEHIYGDDINSLFNEIDDGIEELDDSNSEKKAVAETVTVEPKAEVKEESIKDTVEQKSGINSIDDLF
jgi:replicative DNA helicase